MALEDFFTREKANDGQILELPYPDGSKSQDWLRVRSTESDSFIEAETKAKRKMGRLAPLISDKESPEDDLVNLLQDLERECIGSLISEWSFEIECSKENVLKLLKEAPYICDLVNQFAVKRKLFFTKKPQGSLNGQKENLNLTKNQRDQK